MKQSMQVVAMAAFLGCFAILVITAGSGKARTQENCGEEWKKGFRQEEKKPANTGNTVTRTAHVAMCTEQNKQEVILPVGLFHAIL